MAEDRRRWLRIYLDAAPRVRLCVVDGWPGVPRAHQDRMSVAFQRLGGAHGRFGLAVARGLSETLGGHRIAEDTSDGGLTVVVDQAAVPESRPVDVTPVVYP